MGSKISSWLLRAARVTNRLKQRGKVAQRGALIKNDLLHLTVCSTTHIEAVAVDFNALCCHFQSQ